MIVSCDNNEKDLTELFDFIWSKTTHDASDNKKKYLNNGVANANSLLRFCNDKKLHVEFNSEVAPVVVHYSEDVDEAFEKTPGVDKEDLDDSLPFEIG